MINNYTFPLIDKDEPICQRAKLDTGTFCNYECSFCYYIDRLHEKTDLDVVKQRVDYIYECGIREVDLSGGESSVRTDWFELLDYCKSKEMSVSTVTNGYKFADHDFMKKSKEHGLQEILFSVHGPNNDIHDLVVGRKGAFKRIIKAIENAHDLGILVRINYVVNQHSYSLTDEFVCMVDQVKPYELNFLTLNFFGSANEYLPYKLSTTHIKHCIDIVDVPIINVRYVPYCYMEGYEKYVCNTFQHIYDRYDWNMAVYDQRIDPEVYKKDPLDALYKQEQEDRKRMYYKPEQCKGCKHLLICDGLENVVHDDVMPTEGPVVKEINHYRKEYYAKV